MSLRKLISLRKEFYSIGLNIDFTATKAGLMVEGPLLSDRLIACSELRKRKITVAGHAQKKIDMGDVGMAAL
jgi:hypothetical protein